MLVAPAWFHDSTTAPRSTRSTAWYSILGVPVAVTSNVAEALRRVDETYAAFRTTADPAGGATLKLRLDAIDAGAAYLVADGQNERRWAAFDGALLDLFDRLVHALLGRLLAQGIYAIHAGAVVYRDGALLLAGRSGQGKTTLVLGLLQQGMGLLSDEFAVVEPATQLITPYRRSLHVRPGTLDLIPELQFLADRPRYELGGGAEWALTPDELEWALPDCLGRAAPLRYVLLLDGTPGTDDQPLLTPVPGALAAIALLRGTWGASVNFAGGLDRISRLLDGVACARLRVSALPATIDCVLAWLEARHA